MRLETEVAELRRNLQQAVDHKLKAERGKQDAQDQVNKYTPDPSATASANNLERLFKLARSTAAQVRCLSSEPLRYCLYSQKEIAILPLSII